MTVVLATTLVSENIKVGIQFECKKVTKKLVFISSSSLGIEGVER